MARLRVVLPMTLLAAGLAAAPAQAAPVVCDPAVLDVRGGSATLAPSCGDAIVVGVDQPDRGSVALVDGEARYTEPADGVPAATTFTAWLRPAGEPGAEPVGLPVQVGYRTVSRPSCGLPRPLRVRPNRSIEGLLTCRDSSGVAAEASVVRAPDPASGDVSVVGGTFRFTARGAEGDGSFAVQAVSEGRRSAVVTQAVAVTAAANARPVCSTPPEANVRPQSLRRFALACSDADGDQLAISIVGDPDGGVRGDVRQATSGGSATIDYLSAPDDRKSTVTFVADDGHDGRSDPTTLRIDVNESNPNFSPECRLVRPIVEPGGSLLVSTSCTDDELHPLTFAIEPGSERDVTVEDRGVVDGQATYLVRRADGAATDAGFRYTATDRFGESDTGTVQLDTQRAPSCKAPEPGILRSGRTVTVDVSRLCVGATSLTLAGAGTNGRASMLADGRVEFRVAANAPDGAEASFSLVASNAGTASASVTVVYRTGPNANNPPTCIDGAAANVRLGATRPVAVTCTDPDGDALTVAVEAQPRLGRATASGTAVAYQAPAVAAAPQSDAFTVAVTDRLGGRATAVVPVTIQPTSYNTAPHCDLAVAVAPRPGETRRVELRCADDEDDPVAGVEGATGTNGSVGAFTPVAGSPGRFLAEFTAGAAEGPASFPYAVRDDRGGSRDGLAELVVRPAAANQPPDCSLQPLAAVTGTTLAVDPVGTCTDADGDRLVATPLGDPSLGRLENGVYTAVEAGTETLRFAIDDGHGGDATAVVRIVVRRPPDEPGTDPVTPPAGAGGGAATGPADPPAAAGAGAPAPPAAPAPGPADTVAPTVTVKAAKPRLKALVKRGLPVTVTCSEACRTTITAALPGKVARRIGLVRSARKPAIVVRTGGTGPLVLRFSSRLLKARKVDVTLTVVATDDAGNAATRTLRLKLRR